MRSAEQNRLKLRGFHQPRPTDRPAQEFRPGDRIDHAGLVGTVERVMVVGSGAGSAVAILARRDGDSDDTALQRIEVDGTTPIGRPFGEW